MNNPLTSTHTAFSIAKSFVEVLHSRSPVAGAEMITQEDRESKDWFSEFKYAGINFFISFQRYSNTGNKFEVGVSRPAGWLTSENGSDVYDDKNNRVGQPRIAMSAEKGMEKCVKDFLNRLMQDATHYWNLLNIRLDQHNAYKNKTKDSLTILATAAGEKARASVERQELYLENGKAHVSGDSVSLDLHSLSISQAEAIIKMLQG